MPEVTSPSEPTPSDVVRVRRRRGRWVAALAVAVVGVTVVSRWLSRPHPLNAEEQRLVGRWHWEETGRKYGPATLAYDEVVRADRTISHVPTDPKFRLIYDKLGSLYWTEWRVEDGRLKTVDDMPRTSTLGRLPGFGRQRANHTEFLIEWDGPDRVTFVQANLRNAKDYKPRTWVRIPEGAPSQD